MNEFDFDKLFRPLTDEEIEELKEPMKEIAKDFKAIIDHYNESKMTKRVKNIHYKE